MSYYIRQKQTKKAKESLFQVGELLVQGPQVMKGYRDNEEATKNAITEDGWFKTGDLAKINDDGSVVIHDRLKELIKVKEIPIFRFLTGFLRLIFVPGNQGKVTQTWHT